VMGLDMMFRTSTVQVNLDFSSEADMVKKLRVSLALQPIATAIFANSPFTNGKPNGFLSMRSEIWRHTDNDRTGMIPFAFESGMGFERYVDWALDVPLYFVKRGSIYHDVSGASFRDLMDGKLAALPGERATMSDWVNHLGTLFPEVRLKRYLEMRGADAGPTARLAALSAFWVGLLYDEGALDAAWDLVKDWSAQERQALRDAVPRQALQTPFRTQTAGDIARRALTIARAGLEARNVQDWEGRSEAHFLDQLDAVVDSGVTAADRLLSDFRGPWDGEIDRVFDTNAY
jgi:glutamate--cysteine ligase